MRPEHLARIRARLEAMREEIVHEGDARVRVDREEAVAGAADEDQAPHEEMDQAIASSRNRTRAVTLARIDAALRRLDADPDAYGTCADCDDEIPLRRLELMPFVRLCVECQAKRDPARGGARKHVLDFKG